MTHLAKAILSLALALVGLVFGASILGSSAFVGERPAIAMKPNAREPVTFQPAGATDLGREMAGAKDHELRFRKLTESRGEIVPWHSHDRPALIYFAEGEIMEYASNCSMPIVHKAVRAISRPVAIRPISCPP